MTYSLKIADAAFTKYLAVAPYIDLAKAFYVYGGNQAASVKNYANPAKPATVLGAPTYSDGYASLTGAANGFNSGIIFASPCTHIAVATLNSDGGAGAYCGSWGNPTTNGAMLARNGVDLGLFIDANSRANVADLTAGFHLIAGSHDGTTAKVYNHDGTTLTSASAAYTGGTVSTSPFKVGGLGYGGPGTFNCAAAMTFDSVLSAGQITEIYDYLKELLAGRGVAVQ